MEKLSLVLASYMLGSIPFSYIMGRWFGKIDIRQHGTRKVSASNVIRTVGKLPGYIAGVADVFKGTAVVLLVRRLQMPESVVVFCGIAAIAGHDWPIYLRFYGGRGLGTSLGVLLVTAPQVLIIALIPMLWGAITHNAGVGVGLGILLLPFLGFIFHYSSVLLFLMLMIVLFTALSRLRGIWKITENRKQEFWNRLIRNSSR